MTIKFTATKEECQALTQDGTSIIYLGDQSPANDLMRSIRGGAPITIKKTSDGHTKTTSLSTYEPDVADKTDQEITAEERTLARKVYTDHLAESSKLELMVQNYINQQLQIAPHNLMAKWPISYLGMADMDAVMETMSVNSGSPDGSFSMSGIPNSIRKPEFMETYEIQAISDNTARIVFTADLLKIANDNGREENTHTSEKPLRFTFNVMVDTTKDEPHYESFDMSYEGDNVFFQQFAESIKYFYQAFFAAQTPGNNVNVKTNLQQAALALNKANIVHHELDPGNIIALFKDKGYETEARTVLDIKTPSINAEQATKLETALTDASGQKRAYASIQATGVDVAAFDFIHAEGHYVIQRADGTTQELTTGNLRNAAELAPDASPTEEQAKTIFATAFHDLLDEKAAHQAGAYLTTDVLNTGFNFVGSMLHRIANFDIFSTARTRISTMGTYRTDNGKLLLDSSTKLTAMGNTLLGEVPLACYAADPLLTIEQQIEIDPANSTARLVSIDILGSGKVAGQLTTAMKAYNKLASLSSDVEMKRSTELLEKESAELDALIKANKPNLRRADLELYKVKQRLGILALLTGHKLETIDLAETEFLFSETHQQTNKQQYIKLLGKNERSLDRLITNPSNEKMLKNLEILAQNTPILLKEVTAYTHELTETSKDFYCLIGETEYYRTKMAEIETYNDRATRLDNEVTGKINQLSDSILADKARLERGNVSESSEAPIKASELEQQVEAKEALVEQLLSAKEKSITQNDTRGWLRRKLRSPKATDKQFANHPALANYNAAKTAFKEAKNHGSRWSKVKRFFRRHWKAMLVGAVVGVITVGVGAVTFGVGGAILAGTLGPVGIGVVSGAAVGGAVIGAAGGAAADNADGPKASLKAQAEVAKDTLGATSRHEEYSQAIEIADRARPTGTSGSTTHMGTAMTSTQGQAPSPGEAPNSGETTALGNLGNDNNGEALDLPPAGSLAAGLHQAAKPPVDRATGPTLTSR